MPGRASRDPAGHTAIVVDDGLATGATARAALLALRLRGASRLILAVPVAPAPALAALRQEADAGVAVIEADLLHGIGGHYLDFHQLEDEEVIGLLAKHDRRDR